MVEPAVLLLIYNRPETTALVMDSVRAARPARLYVAADGPRDRSDDRERCGTARHIATFVDWPCELHTLFRDRNLGCGEAVSSAITWFFESEDEGIILEDDCLPAPDFFRFCSELLARYRGDARVMAVCGSCYAKPDSAYNGSYYFSYYADPWGWATWRRAWRLYDCDLSRWPAFKARGRIRELFPGERWRQEYWATMFDLTRAGRIDTWDYQWIYSVMEHGGLACYPVRNLVSNIGFRADATHTKAAAGEVLPQSANRPLEKLAFPLMHSARVSRSEGSDRQIEAVRLGLAPPSARSKVKAVARRILGEKSVRLAKGIARRALNLPSRLV